MTTRSSLSRFLAAALFASLALVLGSVPAQAHDQLIGSNPKQGAKLDKQPEWIELNYSGEIQDIGSEIRVEKDGEDFSAGEITVEGRTVTAALPDDLKPGDYTIAWRVVSQDGHPISGKVEFTLLDSAGSGGEVKDGDKTEEGASDDKTEENAEDGKQSDASGQEEASQDASGVSPVVLILLAVAGLGALVAVFVMFTRKKNVIDDSES
ncbi:copper resistance protein CopC [Brevibacterium sp. Marseille-P9724]|uniref:copper resistance CopC family protein n=1 Tax=Brevibacterium sp. Marseille-P9724 TaxID=2614125 RepID=UPI001D035AF6|nr:copper resistance CopC family protein [Brevibacterium sp. Marseille-P9724]